VQAQVIVANTTPDVRHDVGSSLSFLSGFRSQTCWVVITAYLMDTAGHTTGLMVLNGMHTLKKESSKERKVRK
jgi:hypothetical protein